MEQQSDLERANIHYELGDEHYINADWAKAAAELTEAIHFNPAHVEAHLLLGRTFAQMSKADAAIAEYEKVLSLDPSNRDAYYNLGWVFYYDKRESEKAIAMWKEVLRFDPSDRAVLFHIEDAMAKP